MMNEQLKDLWPFQQYFSHTEPMVTMKDFVQRNLDFD